MRKTVRSNTYRMMLFFATVAVAVLLLKLLNWVPGAIQQEDLRKYRTLDEVRSALKFKKVYLPTYFPEHMRWPPIEIFAQRKPFTMVVMHFSHATEQNLALSIYQVDERARFEPQATSAVLYVRRESTVLVKGREGTLTLAVCEGNRQCNRLSWKDGGFRLTIIADDAPEQMMRLAESML